MKKIISLLTVSTVLFGAVLAYADDEEITDQESIVIGEAVSGEDVLVSSAVNYDKKVLEGTLKEASDEQLILDIGSEYAINIDENTLILDENAKAVALADLAVGSKVKVIADAKTTMSLPPQSYGYIVMVSEQELPAFPLFAEADKVEFDEDLYKITSADGQYIIKVTEDTKITTLDGADLTATDIKEGDSVLFYTNILTLSIPAQATADKLVVIGSAKAEKAIADFDKVMVNGTDVATKVIVDGDHTLLHVRAICEAMGYEVSWDEKLFAVTVGTVPMGVTFKIGENAYNKAKMTPAELSAAPQIIDDFTYVPVDFFEEILEAKVDVEDGVLKISVAVN